jgi:hypothetical protein
VEFGSPIIITKVPCGGKTKQQAAQMWGQDFILPPAF